MNNQGIGLEKATQIALRTQVSQRVRSYADERSLTETTASAYMRSSSEPEGCDYDYVISSGDGTIIEVDREYAGGQLGGFDSSSFCK